MKRRLLSSAVIVPSIIAAMFYMPSVGLLLVILTVAIVAMLEFYKLLDGADIPAFRYVGAACGALIMAASYAGYVLNADKPGMEAARIAAEWEGMALVLTVMILLVRQFPQKNNEKPLSTIACTLLGILYAALLPNFFTKLALSWDFVDWKTPLIGRTGLYMIFYTAWVTKWTDAGALFIGKAIGKHKLFPRLSPKKTWEGLIGGLSFSIIFSCMFVAVAKNDFGGLHVSWLHAVMMGLALGVAGMVGDMAESLMKRAAATKDSAALAPGLGGILDIFDSLFFAAPIMYMYAKLFL